MPDAAPKAEALLSCGAREGLVPDEAAACTAMPFPSAQASMSGPRHSLLCTTNQMDTSSRVGSR